MKERRETKEKKTKRGWKVGCKNHVLRMKEKRVKEGRKRKDRNKAEERKKERKKERKE